MRSFRSYTTTLFADKANNCTSDQHKIIASDKVAQHQNLVISSAGRAFLCLREDLKQVGKSFAGSLAIIIIARPSQTSRQLAPLKASYSHARAEALITRLVTRTLEGLKTQDTENRKYYSITKKKPKKNTNNMHMQDKYIREAPYHYDLLYQCPRKTQGAPEEPGNDHGRPT